MLLKLCLWHCGFDALSNAVLYCLIKRTNNRLLELSICTYDRYPAIDTRIDTRTGYLRHTHTQAGRTNKPSTHALCRQCARQRKKWSRLTKFTGRHAGGCVQNTAMQHNPAGSCMQDAAQHSLGCSTSGKNGKHSMPGRGRVGAGTTLACPEKVRIQPRHRHTGHHNESNTESSYYVIVHYSYFDCNQQCQGPMQTLMHTHSWGLR